MSKSLFIVFTGIGGSGKTTLSNLLVEYLSKKLMIDSELLNTFKPQHQIMELKELISNKTENFDNYYSTDILCYAYLCDLWENTKKFILPELYPQQQNKILVADRYWLCSLISAKVLNCNFDFIQNIVKLFPVPDLYVYLDISPETAYNRIYNRDILNGKKLSIQDNNNNLCKLRVEYLNHFSKHSINHIFVNTEDKSISETSDIINKAIENYYYKNYSLRNSDEFYSFRTT